MSFASSTHFTSSNAKLGVVGNRVGYASLRKFHAGYLVSFSFVFSIHMDSILSHSLFDIYSKLISFSLFIGVDIKLALISFIRIDAR